MIGGNTKDQKDRNHVTGKIVVISDTHFGDRTQLLTDASLVDSLCEVLQGRGPIEELVLLGDIIDLWVSVEMSALRKARYFIERVSALSNVGRIVYIPGNHDHSMFMNAFNNEMDRRVTEGDLTVPRFMPARSYNHAIMAGLARHPTVTDFSMTYPFIVRKVNGKKVLLTHGHHLDFYDSSFGWSRTFWLGRHYVKKREGATGGKVTLHDIEMANLPFCGAMSAAPWVPELVAGGLRFYRMINFFAKLFRKDEMRHGLIRDTLIKENYDEIEGLLPLFGQPDTDCFIFGHTHCPGIGRVPGTGLLVANTGSWTSQDDEDMPTMTWVELDGEVSLFRMTGEGPELMFSEPLENGGGRDGE